MAKNLFTKKPKAPKAPKQPPTIDMKGLQCVLASVFFFTMRLLLTEGLASLSLVAAGIFMSMGFVRWKKRCSGWKLGILFGIAMVLGGFVEIWGYSAPDTTSTTAVHAAATVLCTIAAVYASVMEANTAAELCRIQRDEQTCGILLQRRWWIAVIYGLDGCWTIFDLFTGLYPNVGVVMRILAIAVNVFYLSALFQTRKLLE